MQQKIYQLVQEVGQILCDFILNLECLEYIQKCSNEKAKMSSLISYDTSHKCISFPVVFYL